jgi:serine/threonine protein kinase
MAILYQCPNPECGVSAPGPEAFNGKNVRCKRCGRPFRAQPSLDGSPINLKEPPRQIVLFPVLPAEFGRYKILKLLGQGGMGAVYLAEDAKLARQVALKIPFFDGKDSPLKAERFVREARSAASLHHPNICTVYDAGQIQGRPFMTMALIEGTSLEDLINPEKLMPQGRVAEIAVKVARALEHAHQRGTVHRDLKPANIMLTPAGEPIVMDFGLAKRVNEASQLEAKLTKEGAFIGTPSYMAPEQVRGDVDAIGPTTDVYALGVILFEMLTGNTPYSGSIGVVVGQILASPVPSVKEFRKEIDLQLNLICGRAMAKETASRFPSMGSFAGALEAYLDTTNPRQSRMSVMAPPVEVDPERLEKLKNELLKQTSTKQPTVKPLSRKRRWMMRSAMTALIVLICSLLAFGLLQLEKSHVPVAFKNVIDEKKAEVVAQEKIEPKADETPKKEVILFAPEKSEWAGTGTLRDSNGERPLAGTLTITERVGTKFKAINRGGLGWRTILEGTIDEVGQITIEAREVLSPNPSPRENWEGSGEFTRKRMSFVSRNPNNGNTSQFEYKLIPDGGDNFNFEGRWRILHVPSNWPGWRTITATEQITDRPHSRGPWERDGGMFITHYPNGGVEWIVIDPDNPNVLHGTNGTQYATWTRQ